jgi:hypothetical protein
VSPTGAQARGPLIAIRAASSVSGWCGSRVIPSADAQAGQADQASGAKVVRPVGVLAQVWWLGSGRHEDSFAEQVDVGAAEHLAFEHLDAVDVAFDRAGVPGQGESGCDGVLVVLDAFDERAQAGQFGGRGLGEPVGQAFAVSAGHHDGEVVDVGVQGVQFRAAIEDRLELGVVLGVEAAGVLDHPADDGAD